jgi:hypothetical protein
MIERMEAGDFYKVMMEAAGKVGYLSGDSCKVLIALALRPESRQDLLALKQVTCIEDDEALVQAVSDLRDFNLLGYDGKGGFVLNDAKFNEVPIGR